MDETDDFFSEAVNTARDVLAELVTRAGLHLRPEILSRGMARQCRVRLTFLMNYIRQLIFLMAAGMIDTLAPVKTRAGAGRAKLPDGVEDVTASFLAASGPRPWRFALAPGHYAPMPDMPDIPRKAMPDEVPAGRFIEKVIALGGILADPAPHAKRMARALHRWRTAGEMAPVSLQVIPRFRAGRLAESFAQILSVRLNDALTVAWNDTG
ncbi:hypothetical protein [Hyphomonas sp.]|uniref:hypothetical protein n=1 Tax=Hyphomonas sp. TaxID=87 RepID=UPI000C60E4F0|nr:hypothetical protein [Hyphomonas sp.]MAB09703.1 hypothetical protein [Hyphomonas sp.]MAU65861.1 hypothetical protein [Hyphomonas sp.]